MAGPFSKLDEALREDIRARLEAHPRLPEADEGLRRAAVVIALTDDGEGRACLLLTRRAGHLRRHRGQWALPGGRMDPGESARTAALRELREELGVDLDESSLLGRIDDYRSRSGYHIRPWVAWCGADRQLRPDPGEVAAVYRLPLGELHEAVPADGVARTAVPSLGLLGTRIFAPTAALLFQFAEVALRGRPTRVGTFEEPQFAWR